MTCCGLMANTSILQQQDLFLALIQRISALLHMTNTRLIETHICHHSGLRYQIGDFSWLGFNKELQQFLLLFITT